MPSAVPPCFRRCRTLLTGGPSRLRDDRSALPCIAGALRRSLLTSAARAASWFGPEAPGAIPSSSSLRLAPAAGSLDRHATGTRPVHSPSLRDVRGVWARAPRGVKHLYSSGTSDPPRVRRRTDTRLSVRMHRTARVRGTANAVAERVGFEPTKSFDSALFKSAAINRSATSPAVRIPAAIRIPGPSSGSQSLAIASRPRYGRSTSGTSTEPSGRWYVSSSAATTRARARPEPLSVWTSSGFAPGSGR